MSSHAVALSQSAARAERYRQAEQAVWDHYGLEPSERFVDVGEPAARIRVAAIRQPTLMVYGTAMVWLDDPSAVARTMERFLT